MADVGDGLRRLTSPLRRIFNSVHATRTHRKQRTKDGANKSFIARRAALVDTDRAVGTPRRAREPGTRHDTTTHTLTPNPISPTSRPQHWLIHLHATLLRRLVHLYRSLR